MRNNPVIPPCFVHKRQNPSFLWIFSNQSVGGKKNGKATVNNVKLTVGAETASIADLSAAKLIRIPMFYSGPDIPPSLRIRQKWTAMNIMAIKGIPIQCNT